MKQLPYHRHAHPLFLAAIILGAIAGIFLAIPRRIRGWVILLILTSLAGFWFGWSAHKDEVMAGTVQPVVARDYAPRAELVRLPSVK